MAIDSHTHINSLVLKNPLEEITNINNSENISKVINVGLNIQTSKESISISETNSKFYSAIGIHPLYTSNQNIDELIELAIHSKVVAIGEIGLDSHHNNYEEQKQYLIKQIIIANEFKLPVIIHSSNSNEEIINIFKTIVKPLYGCVFHCFQPDIKTLQYLIDNGYYISFAGKITYKNAKKSLEIAKIVPNELFIVETDSPYISPEPHRNEPNTSLNIPYIIRRLSEIRETSYTEIEKQTIENTKRLFKTNWYKTKKI